PRNRGRAPAPGVFRPSRNSRLLTAIRNSSRPALPVIAVLLFPAIIAPAQLFGMGGKAGNPLENLLPAFGAVKRHAMFDIAGVRPRHRPVGLMLLVTRWHGNLAPREIKSE